MGTYTKYKFSVMNTDLSPADEVFMRIRADARTYQNLEESGAIENFRESYIKKLRNSSERIGVLKYAPVFDEIDHSVNDGDCQKWYSHETDIAILSEAFPEFIFQLDGAVEDGRHFRKWWRNGIMQGGDAVLVYPNLRLNLFES